MWRCGDVEMWIPGSGYLDTWIPGYLGYLTNTKPLEHLYKFYESV